MEIIHNILQVVILTISGLGAAVVVWGVIEAIVAFVGLKFSSTKEDPVSKSETVRQHLGAHLLLGLEIFIAADIISSAVSPSWEKVRHTCSHRRCKDSPKLFSEDGVKTRRALIPS